MFFINHGILFQASFVTRVNVKSCPGHVIIKMELEMTACAVETGAAISVVVIVVITVTMTCETVAVKSCLGHVIGVTVKTL